MALKTRSLLGIVSCQIHNVSLHLRFLWENYINTLIFFTALASSEGSAPSQFVPGVGQHFSTQATAGYSSSSQQSPVVPFPARLVANATNLPGPSNAPPVLRR